MLELGPTEGVIISNRTKNLGGKIAVAIMCQIGNETGEALIFITEKAMGMARRALKLCGFDVDERDLVEIDLHPDLLAGNKVKLLVDEWNGKTQIKIDIDSRAEKRVLDAATAKLRAAKKSNEAEASRPQPKSAPIDDYGDIPF